MTYLKGLLRNKRRWLLGSVTLAVLVALVVQIIPALALDDAHSYDMTWRGASDTVNGSIIEAFTPTDSTGTGYWHSFLRVSSANKTIVKGYNSDYKKKANVEFNEDPSWTQSFLLQDVPQVKEGDIIYREFQLDINQNSKDTGALLSVDDLEIWLTDTQMNDTVKDGPIDTSLKHPFYDDETAGDMYFVWALDGYQKAVDNVILLNFGLNPGSGKRDFKLLVPNDLFDPSYTYIVLYTEHGGDEYTGYYDLDADPATTDDVVFVENQIYGNNDGFEEWGVARYPAVMVLAN